jgi:hypothetical protein
MNETVTASGYAAKVAEMMKEIENLSDAETLFVNQTLVMNCDPNIVRDAIDSAKRWSSHGG